MPTWSHLAIAALALLPGIAGCATGPRAYPSPVPCPLASQELIGARTRDHPSRDEIMEQAECIAPDVRPCFQGDLGEVLTVSFVVDGWNGRARLLRAQLAHTVLFDDADDRATRPSGRCLEQAVTRMRFAPFKSPMLTITFPYKV